MGCTPRRPVELVNSPSFEIGCSTSANAVAVSFYGVSPPSAAAVKVTERVYSRKRSSIQQQATANTHCGVATRYDKLARNFLAAVVLASIRICLKYYESTT
jgi:hypothetical protein